MSRPTNPFSIALAVSWCCAVLLSSCNDHQAPAALGTLNLPLKAISSDKLVADFNEIKNSQSYETVVNTFSATSWKAVAKAKPTFSAVVDGFNFGDLDLPPAAAADVYSKLAGTDKNFGRTLAKAGWNPEMNVTVQDLRGAIKVLKGTAARVDPLNQKEKLLIAKLFVTSLATSTAGSTTSLSLDDNRYWNGPFHGVGCFFFFNIPKDCRPGGSASTGSGTGARNGGGTGSIRNGGGSNTAGQSSAIYNAQGYNSEGYNRDGYNSSGYNRQGYNPEGCNKDGNFSNGTSCHPGR